MASVGVSFGMTSSSSCCFFGSLPSTICLFRGNNCHKKQVNTTPLIGMSRKVEKHLKKWSIQANIIPREMPLPTSGLQFRTYPSLEEAEHLIGVYQNGFENFHIDSDCITSDGTPSDYCIQAINQVLEGRKLVKIGLTVSIGEQFYRNLQNSSLGFVLFRGDNFLLMHRHPFDGFEEPMEPYDKDAWEFYRQGHHWAGYLDGLVWTEQDQDMLKAYCANFLHGVTIPSYEETDMSYELRVKRFERFTSFNLSPPSYVSFLRRGLQLSGYQGPAHEYVEDCSKPIQ